MTTTALAFAAVLTVCCCCCCPPIPFIISFWNQKIFDPLGLSKGAAPGEIKKWREAEIKHGRVAMLAALGVLVAEVRELMCLVILAAPATSACPVILMP